MRAFLLLLMLTAAGLLGCRGAKQHVRPLPAAVVSAPVPPQGEVVRGDGFQRSDVVFPCGETRCAAWLFLPDPAPAPPPVVVMAHGFSGQREMTLDEIGARFAQAGMAAFVFDYRGWGDSGGEPRYQIVAEDQIEDYLAAIRHVRAMPAVDGERVAAWGTSFSGGHVLFVAHRDPDVAAVVSQVPMTDGLAEGDLEVPGDVAWRMLQLAFLDKFRAIGGRERLYIPVYGEPGEVVFIPGEEGNRARAELVDAGSSWPNRVAPDVLLDFDEFRPRKIADEVTQPAFFVLAEGDQHVSNKANRKTIARMPDATVLTVPGGHFDVYAGALLDQVVTAQVRFLHGVFGMDSADLAER